MNFNYKIFKKKMIHIRDEFHKRKSSRFVVREKYVSKQEEMLPLSLFKNWLTNIRQMQKAIRRKNKLINRLRKSLSEHESCDICRGRKILNDIVEKKRESLQGHPD